MLLYCESKLLWLKTIGIWPFFFQSYWEYQHWNFRCFGKLLIKLMRRCMKIKIDKVLWINWFGPFLVPFLMVALFGPSVASSIYLSTNICLGIAITFFCLIALRHCWSCMSQISFSTLHMLMKFHHRLRLAQIWSLDDSEFITNTREVAMSDFLMATLTLPWASSFWTC